MAHFNIDTYSFQQILLACVRVDWKKELACNFLFHRIVLGKALNLGDIWLFFFLTIGLPCLRSPPSSAHRSPHDTYEVPYRQKFDSDALLAPSSSSKIKLSRALFAKVEEPLS